jgi:hypothetical protein
MIAPLRTSTTPTMSSVELVDVINSMRGPGRAVLEHADFMKKVKGHPGIDAGKFSGIYHDASNRKQPCYYLPKRECELMVMSESLEVQTKVLDRLIELEGSAPAPRQIGIDPALSAFRTARAIATNAKTAALICSLFPTLGQAARQTIYAKLVNAAAGDNIVPLPIVENLLGATEVGAKFNISANAIGKLANTHGLKVEQYGEFVMDKSRHSSKQMPSFRYNAAGVAKIGELIGAQQHAPPKQATLIPQ